MDFAIRAKVVEQVNLLRGVETFLSRKFETGKTLIVGAVYNLNSGKLECIEETISSASISKKV